MIRSTWSFEFFSTEQYYSEYRSAMHDFSSNFSDMVFTNLSTDAQAWYRDVQISPLTWSVFKEGIPARFRDKDFRFKTLTKIYELKATKSQQEYTSRFLHLREQVDTEVSEVVKRWFFPQNLRADTSAYISRNVPDTLNQAIEMAQSFETQSPLEPANQNVKAKNSSQGNNKSKKNASKDNPKNPHGGRVPYEGTRHHHYCKFWIVKKRLSSCFVDSGSSLNAISPKLAEKLDIEVKQYQNRYQ
ncbi:LOW QUALITY PROTEIN: hypothetical protein PHMEG_00014122 [Phytophthora megakarya]|uniref:Ty3 transposon capsid-like protein domain-containing protein n=1 Tax=Phytophthora megakarya TaxID=4795 RepID=A0A225W548_9STRA|nr:LOW QUALITY PROTEIN: hypothetical protein PHMEG_00014122 [Phytophthora megakarya]